MSDDWTATNAFLNFLSYSDSMRTLSVLDSSMLLMSASIRDASIEFASKISQGLIRFEGASYTEPYDFFCTNCKAGLKAAKWLTDWLSTQSYQFSKFGKDKHQLVFVGGTGTTFTIFMTPQQKEELCGDKCLDPNLKMPEWLKDIVNGATQK
jgi:hypothetical protein